MGFLSFRTNVDPVYRTLVGYTSPLHLTSVVAESLEHLSSGGKHVLWVISEELCPKSQEDWATFSLFMKGLREAFEVQDERFNCHFAVVFRRQSGGGGKEMIQITRLGQAQAKILPFRRKHAT